MQISTRVLIGLGVAMALVVSACSSDGDQTVTVYSGRTEDLIQPILDDFTEETGIAVVARFADSADLALLLAEEGDRSPADVFLSQSPGAVEFLDTEGLLATLPNDILDLVPPTVRDSEGHWVGFSGRQRVLVYNPNLVDATDLPTSVLDLTDARWEGQVGLAPANGSFQDFVTAMRGQIGDDQTTQWLEGLVANDAQSYAGNSAIVAAVGRGEIALGLVNHYYNYRAVEEDPNHAGLNHQLAADDPGSILIVTSAAKLAASEHGDEADQLIKFLLSESAQTFFATETYEYPLAAGVAPAPAIPPADFADVSGINFGELGSQLSATRDMIIDAGLEG